LLVENLVISKPILEEVAHRIHASPDETLASIVDTMYGQAELYYEVPGGTIKN
jgi:hypothetical protein